MSAAIKHLKCINVNLVTAAYRGIIDEGWDYILEEDGWHYNEDVLGLYYFLALSIFPVLRGIYIKTVQWPIICLNLHIPQILIIKFALFLRIYWSRPAEYDESGATANWCRWVVGRRHDGIVSPPYDSLPASSLKCNELRDNQDYYATQNDVLIFPPRLHRDLTSCHPLSKIMCRTNLITNWLNWFEVFPKPDMSMFTWSWQGL